MPKAKLEFNLPEEKEEYQTHMNAYQYRAVISDLLNEMRSVFKYEALFNGVQEKDVTLEVVRTRIHELLNEHGVSEDF